MNIKNIAKSLSIVALVNVSACSNLVGTTTNQSIPESLKNLGVSFTWENTSRCLGTSPEFTLTEVPATTHTLNFTLRDIYFPFFPHGGGSLEYTGINVIPEGSVTAAKGHYIGPCAPPFFPGRYKFTVEALDRNGLLIGKGNATRPFPHR